jgi:hypothetical protein
MNEKGSITVTKITSSNPEDIYTLFYIHGSKLNSFIESIPKSKKNRRCIIHSLDKSKSIKYNKRNSSNFFSIKYLLVIGNLFGMQ